MEEKKKISIHAVLGILIAAIVIFCVVRLILWDKRSVIVDTDIDPGTYDMECMDFYVYPDEEQLANHPDDGEEHIVVIGNDFVGNRGKRHSIINILKDRMDAKFYDLSSKKAFLTSEALFNTATLDGFSLYYQVWDLVNGDKTNPEKCPWGDVFQDRGDKKRYLADFDAIDINKIDTVMIMYSMYDYYNTRPTLVLDGEDIRGYHGALYSSIKLLKDSYPHLNVIVVSPYPTFLYGENKSMILANATDYGWGTASVYIEHALAVATELCVSYIDNYFYVINDSNITEYVDEFNLTDKGVSLIADHIIKFLTVKDIQ